MWTLSTTKNIILWHDLINNTFTTHPSNDFKPLKIHGLISNLYAIVYCKKDKATYNCSFEDSRTLDVPVINFTKHTLYYRKIGRKCRTISQTTASICRPRATITCNIPTLLTKHGRNLHDKVKQTDTSEEKRSQEKKTSREGRSKKLVHLFEVYSFESLIRKYSFFSLVHSLSL